MTHVPSSNLLLIILHIFSSDNTGERRGVVVSDIPQPSYIAGQKSEVTQHKNACLSHEIHPITGSK